MKTQVASVEGVIAKPRQQCATLFVLDRALILYYPPFVIDGAHLIHDEELGSKLGPIHFTIAAPGPIVAFVDNSVTFRAATDPNTSPEIVQEPPLEGLRASWRTGGHGLE